MGKKAKRRGPLTAVPKPSRGMTATQIVLIYLGIVGATIFLSLHYDIALDAHQQPTVWLQIIWFIYYALPWVLSIIFGAALRPFIKNARNLLIAIVAIQIFISFIVSSIRHEYLRRLDQSIQHSRWAELKVLEFEKEIFDDNGDSVIDRMLFHGMFNMKDFPTGQYRLMATLVKTTDGDAQEFVIGSFTVPWESRKGNIIKGHFELNFEKCPEAFKDGVFHLDLDLERLITLDATATKILAVSRWIPFFRTTSWTAQDPDLHERKLPLAHIDAVTSFTILPLAI